MSRKPTAPRLPVARLREAFATMLLVRTLDDKLSLLQRQGRIGFYGACTGQEATPIATAMALRPEDWIFPALREGAAALHRGLSLEHYVAQCFGNAADLQKGRQMPCHYMSRAVNHVSWSSCIATQLTHAAGAAYAAKVRGDDVVTVGFMGDGATSEGEFHSALNFASVQQVPCVFVCQNNQFAISVRHDRQTATKTYAEKAAAYGMPGVRVDGNDVEAVHAAVTEAVERARSGDGPTLIEAVTYRMTPHSSSDDPSRYRDDAEVEEWAKRDPLLLLRKRLQQEKDGWSQAWEDELAARFSAEVAEAIAAAEAAAPVAPESLMDDVYAEPPELLSTQRQRLLQAVADGEVTWPPQAD